MPMLDGHATRRIKRVEQPFHLRLTLPGSKSIALRHILMSALAEVPTRLLGVPRCDDVEALFGAIVRLGSTVGELAGVGEASDVEEVEGYGKAVLISPPAKPCTTDVELDLGMSGVSLRLLLAAAMLRTAHTRFSGHAQLHRRPNAHLLAALEQIGCQVESNGGLLPISVAGPAEPAPSTTLNASVSSQYLSALLLAAPRLPNGLAIHLEDELPSASYVGVTQAEMARRSATVRQVDEATIVVPHGQYTGGEVTIEGDASAATYHAALATLHGGTVEFANLGAASRQGDYGFLTVCERAGAVAERGEHTTTIRGPKRLAAVGEVDMIDMPDAAPTLMALAPFLPAPTHITGIATLRVKECDRIAAGTTELRKAGVRVDEHPDAMTIHPVTTARSAAFDTYEDHRMAMALSVLASKVGDCRIRGADCVSKTYPNYWEDLQRIY